MSREIGKSGMPMPWVWSEGNTHQDATREFWCDPARSETLSMSGSYLYRSWEISSVPDRVLSGGAGKGNRNPAIHTDEKSDAPIVPKKPSNKEEPHIFGGAHSAEEVEGRGAAKGNAGETPAGRTQCRETASMGLEGNVAPLNETSGLNSRHCCITLHRRYWLKVFTT